MAKTISWYQWEYFWRRGDTDGDNTPQDWDDGTGDLIFNTLTKTRKDGDYSEWAVESFKVCCNLLKDRKRFPDEFIVGEWSRQQQNRMSRDPFIALGAQYAFLMGHVDEETKIELQILFRSVTIPWYLQYSINTMIWWKRLKFDGRKHYVKRLDYFKALATEDTFLRKYENEFYENTYSRRSG
jgi:hypothetical protein